MARIDAKYENWKNKLLDLGKRNRLLNYKETKSSTLKITYPDYNALYKMFVQNEDELVFPRVISDVVSEDDEESTGTNLSVESENEKDYGGYGSFLRTNRKPYHCRSCLRNDSDSAKGT